MDNYNGYADAEKISYEGIVNSINNLKVSIGEESELSSELSKLEQSCDKLVAVWRSESSLNAKNKILEVKNELAKVNKDLDNLVAEIKSYNDATKTINDGTM